MMLCGTIQGNLLLIWVCSHFNLWHQWFKINTQQYQRQISQPHSTSSPRWEKPREGWLKCNIDTGFFEAEGVTSTARCVRDHHGHFIVAEAA